jgi:membrane associated rhomboid family serine protease
MIFPIGDDQVRGGHTPYFSYLFILINTVVFIYEINIPSYQLNSFIAEFGVTPGKLTEGEGWYTLITSIFLHGGWAHFLGNMLFLWVFADNIESSVGSFRFLIFYLLGGVLASMAHIFFNQGSLIPTIGASGAISAVMGAYLVMFPGSKIKVIVIFFFLAFRLPAFVFLGIWIAQQLLSGFASVGMSAAGGGVAWWAHIGGFAFGLLWGVLNRRFVPLRGELEVEEYR